MNKKSKKQTQRSLTKFVVLFWFCVLLGFVGVVGLMYAIEKEVFGKLPDFKELENPKSALASEVYSTDGHVIGKYYSENRSNTTYEDLSPNLINALVTTEDVRYENHSGIDGRALLRVVYGIISGRGAGGGSTITQQLAKNLFRTRAGNLDDEGWLAKSFGRNIVITKFKEWNIAAKLERSYTKPEIISMYLNTVEFSDGAFGIKSASRIYFDKNPDSLNIQEAAVLVGMLKAPFRFNPRIHPNDSKDRRNVVIGQMFKYGRITETLRDSLQTLPIELNFKRASHTAGLAPYFREYLRLDLAKWARDSANFKVNGEPYNIYRDGLKIYTTLDSRIQSHAEAAVKKHLSTFQQTFFDHWKNKDPWNYGDHSEKKISKAALKLHTRNCPRYKTLKRNGVSKDSMDQAMNSPIPMEIFTWSGPKDTVMSPIDSIKYHRMFLQTGMLVVNPSTGNILAWVGGINYKYFQYDHVNKNTKRQIGSTFKPFIYTIAFDDKGYSPCFEVPNQKITFEAGDPRWGLLEDWTPKNSDDKYGPMISLQEGLATSTNTVSARLMHAIGSTRPVRGLVANMGIDTNNMPKGPSICLGAADLSVMEMVGAYTTYANRGIFSKPQFLSRIEDKNGNVIKQFSPRQNEALSEQTAYIMLKMLQRVIKPGGTGPRLRFKYKVPGEIAGKTGTTQNHTDGWFIGFTPELLIGVWVGGEDRFMRYRSIQHGQGASMSLPIWAHFMNTIYKDKKLTYTPEAEFWEPTSRINVELDCSKHVKDSWNSFDDDYGSQYEDREK